MTYSILPLIKYSYYLDSYHIFPIFYLLGWWDSSLFLLPRLEAVAEHLEVEPNQPIFTTFPLPFINNNINQPINQTSNPSSFFSKQQHLTSSSLPILLADGDIRVGAEHHVPESPERYSGASVWRGHIRHNTHRTRYELHRALWRTCRWYAYKAISH